jgi:hypothetical protein
MIRIDAWVYDFKGMSGKFLPQYDVQVYNGVNEVHLIEVNGRITGQTLFTYQHYPLVDEDEVNKAYHQWLSDQIDNIIL